MAINPKTRATAWIYEFPEPEELPSHVRNKLEPDTRLPAPSPRPSVDRSADTVRPPTPLPKVVTDPKPSSSSDLGVPPVPAAPRVPVI
jgi:hypothetical protein